jgi:hypothetical protein
LNQPARISRRRSSAQRSKSVFTESLREARTPRRTSPFVDLRTMRSAVWLELRLRAEVSYAEIVDGRLRAPTWRGLTRSAV